MNRRKYERFKVKFGENLKNKTQILLCFSHKKMWEIKKISSKEFDLVISCFYSVLFLIIENLEMILSKNSTLLFVNKKLDFLPQWYQTHRLWLNLLSKTLDKTYEIRSNYLQSHSSITNKMRSILFDWLIEVKVLFICCSIFFQSID